VEVDEVTLQGEVKRLFAGWMFASSPGLHAVEHPIYDVWLTDCKGGTTIISDAQPTAPPAPGQRPPAPRTGTAPGGAASTASGPAGAATRPPTARQPAGPPPQPQQQQQQLAPMPPPGFAIPRR
jgi:hypothetical protein